MILAGDFNCILSKTDSTVTDNYSRALAYIVNGLGLIDAWNTSTSHRMCAYYTVIGASRIDRIYATRNIMSKKLGVEMVAAAFTDHHAVILHIAISAPLTMRGRGYWRMNVAIMSDKNFQNIIQKTMGKMENI
jgi:endonuclease/exonuclease/phosphatase family metal-dependent hydrolase